MTALLVLSTCPNQDVADRISQALVSEGLAACVSRITDVQSTYRWQGKVQTNDEILLLIKNFMLVIFLTFVVAILRLLVLPKKL